jgi:hypothetical protein
MITNSDVTVNGGVTVTDYVSAGNIISSGSATVNDITVNNGNITSSADANITLIPNGTGHVSFSGKRAINGAAPVDLSDFATKEYVDNNELVVGALNGMIAAAVSIGGGEIDIDATKFTDIGTTAGEDVTIGAIGQQLIVLADNANFANATVHGVLYGGADDAELLPIRATSSVTNNGTVQILTETEAVSFDGNGSALYVAGGVAIAKKLIVGDEITTNRIEGPDDIDLVLNPKGTGVVNVSSSQITNVLDPTADNHVATKGYVDANSLQRPPVKYAINLFAMSGVIIGTDTITDDNSTDIEDYFPGAVVGDTIAVYANNPAIGIYTITDASQFNWVLTRTEIPLAGYTYGSTNSKTNVTYITSTNGVIFDSPGTSMFDNNPLGFTLSNNTYTINPKYFSTVGTLVPNLVMTPSATLSMASTNALLSGSTEVSINHTNNGNVTIGANSVNTQQINIRAGKDIGGQVLLDGNQVLCNAPITQANSVVTKEYADAIAKGFGPKLAVRAKTTDIDVAFINSLLTNNNGPLVVDDVNVVAEDRILIAGSTPSAFYGIYRVISNGTTWAIERSADANDDPQVGEVTTGIYTLVQEGTDHATQGWALVSYPGEDLGVSLQTWSPVTATGSGVTNVTVSGAGLSTSGTNVINIALNAADIASTDITSKVLTGYASSSGAVSTTDTILSAFGKLAGNFGTGAANRIPYFSNTSTLANSIGLTFTPGSNTLSTFNATMSGNVVISGGLSTSGTSTLGSVNATGLINLRGNITLNENNGTNPVSIGTGTTTGQITIGGDGNQTVSIRSNSNPVASTAFGSLNIGSSLGTNYTGGNINIANNAAGVLTKIGTGTTTGAVAIGSVDNNINIKTDELSSGEVNLGTGIGPGVSTSVNIGSGTTTGTVTIGNGNNLALCFSGVTDPSSIATKEYADSVAKGFGPKIACKVKTPDVFADTILTNSMFSSGTITFNDDGGLTIDGQNLVFGDRVLFAGTTPTGSYHYGIYVVTNPGSINSQWVLTRSEDADNLPSDGEFGVGIYTFISHGTTHGGQGWMLQSYTGPLDSVSGNQVWSQIATGGGGGGVTSVTVADALGFAVNGFTIANTSTAPEITIDLNKATDVGSFSNNLNLSGLAVTVDADTTINIGSNNQSEVSIKCEPSINGTVNIAHNAGAVTTNIGTGTTAGAVTIKNVVAPIDDDDAVNKFYNDRTNLYKLPVKYRTTYSDASLILDDDNSFRTDFTIQGNNLAITLTDLFAGSTIPGTIDGHPIAVNDRIAVIFESASNSRHQGIYNVTSLGDGVSEYWSLDRASDLVYTDSLAGINFGVLSGSTYGGSSYVIASGTILTNLYIANVGGLTTQVLGQNGGSQVSVTKQNNKIIIDPSKFNRVGGGISGNILSLDGDSGVNINTTNGKDVTIGQAGAFNNTINIYGKTANINNNAGSFETKIGVESTTGAVTIGGGSNEVIINPSVSLDLSNKKISNLATPTADTDAVTKLYVDKLEKLRLPVLYRTTNAEFDAIITNGTYDVPTLSINGTDPSQIFGAVVTSIDGQTYNIGDRIALINTTGNDSRQGIYVIDGTGNEVDVAWKLIRSTDMDEVIDLTNVRIDIIRGTEFAGSSYVIESGGINTTMAISQVSGLSTSYPLNLSSSNIVNIGKTNKVTNIKGSEVNINNTDQNSVTRINTDGGTGAIFMGSSSVAITQIKSTSISVEGATTSICTGLSSGDVTIGNTANNTTITGGSVTVNSDSFTVKDISGTSNLFKVEPNVNFGTVTVSVPNTLMLNNVTLGQAGSQVLCNSDSTAPNAVATREYVNAVATGLGPKLAVKAKTTTTDLSTVFSLGNAAVDSNAKTISGTSGTLTVDGIAIVFGDRVLVADTVAADYYGIYTLTNLSPWVLTRSSDADNTPSSGEVSVGIYTFVQEGTTHSAQGWALITFNGDLGNDNQTWSQITSAGGGVTDVQVSGTGLSVGTAGSVKTITLDSTDFTDVAASGTLSVTGTSTLGSVVGTPLNFNVDSGSNATNINTGTTTGSVTIGGNGNQTVSIRSNGNPGPSTSFGDLNIGSSLGANYTGGNINIGVTSRSVTTNICTGTTTGILTIGGSCPINIAPGGTSAITILNGTTSGGIGICNSSTGGSITIGQSKTGGSINIGVSGTVTTNINSNATSSVLIASNNNGNTSIKSDCTMGTLELGARSGTCSINIGTGSSGTIAIGGTSTGQSLNIKSGVSGSDSFGTISIGSNLTGFTGGTINIGTSAGATNVNIGTSSTGTVTIKNLSVPVSSLDAVTKQYNDGTNLYKQYVRFRTTNAEGLSLISASNYNADVLSSSTASAFPATIDGLSPSVNDRILVVDTTNSNPRQGIYTITQLNPWSLTRSFDMNESLYDIANTMMGITIPIASGTTHGGSTVYINGSTISSTATYIPSVSGVTISGSVDVSTIAVFDTASNNRIRSSIATTGRAPIINNVGQIIIPNSNTLSSIIYGKTVLPNYSSDTANNAVGFGISLGNVMALNLNGTTLVGKNMLGNSSTANNNVMIGFNNYNTTTAGITNHIVIGNGNCTNANSTAKTNTIMIGNGLFNSANADPTASCVVNRVAFDVGSIATIANNNIFGNNTTTSCTAFSDNTLLGENVISGSAGQFVNNCLIGTNTISRGIYTPNIQRKSIVGVNNNVSYTATQDISTNSNLSLFGNNNAFTYAGTAITASPELIIGNNNTFTQQSASPSLKGNTIIIGNLNTINYGSSSNSIDRNIIIGNSINLSATATLGINRCFIAANGLALSSGTFGPGTVFINPAAASYTFSGTYAGTIINSSLNSSQASSGNVMIESSATLHNNNQFSGNTYINSGTSGSGSNFSVQNCIFLGLGTTITLTSNISNRMYVNPNLDLSPIAGGTTFVMDTLTGQIGPTSSSRNSKNTIEPFANKYNSSDIIEQLEPKTYNFNVGNTPSIGLIAEDIYPIIPEIVPLNKNNEPSSIRYDLLTIILLEEIKKQKATIASQKNTIDAILARLDAAGL